MNLASLHRRRQPWALALLLALLLFTGWGQVHRVLHLGVPDFSPAEAVAASVTPGLADEDGSGLCQLLDQLSHGAGLAAVHMLALPSAAPQAAPVLWAGRVLVTRVHAFEARGPPRPT